MKINYTKEEVLEAIKTVENQLKIRRELLLETGIKSYKSDIIASTEQLRILNQLLANNADKEMIEV